MQGLQARLAPPRNSWGRVFINRNRCKGCGFCIEFCPPKVLVFTASYNDHGYHPPELRNGGGCTGCDQCGLYCPDFAIYGALYRGDRNREGSAQ
jgi:2-oxoglutarate ferredoxin oxidoreductase subunit delta